MKYHKFSTAMDALNALLKFLSYRKFRDIIFYTLLYTIILYFQVIAASCLQAKEKLYYSIHSESYHNLDSVKSSVSSFKGKGYDAFYEEVDLPEKGHWYRVYLGKYAAREQAEAAADKLKQNNIIDSFRIHKLPSSAFIPAVSKTKKKLNTAKSKAASHPLQDPPATIGGQILRYENKKIEGVARHNKKNAAAENTVNHKLVAAPPSSSPYGQDNAGISEPASPLIVNALKAVEIGRYDEALDMLKKVIRDGAPDGIEREQAFRLAADCFYFKGANGRLPSLLKAVDQYKALLQRYPDPASGNDKVYYRMASAYERLKFYYEAVAALDRLIVTFPESVFMQDAMFKIGDLFYQTGKYNRAIERLIAYLNKFPDGKFVRQSQFVLGDSYYKLKKGSFALRWYDEAWKRWPDLHNVSKETILNMGNNYFELGKYAEAYQIYSLYVNLYPSDESGRECLYNMARGAEQAGSALLALKIYSIIIERYPTEKVAEDSALSMANLGVYQQGLKLPPYLTEINDYLEPLKTYDRLLAKYPSGEMASNILSLKADALGKYGMTKEAFAAYVELIGKFPRSQYAEDWRKKLKAHTIFLVKGYFEKADYLKVSDIYFQCFEKKLLPLDDFDTTFKIGESLCKIGLYDDAARIYEAKRGAYGDQEKDDGLVLALAKIDFAKGRYDDAENKLMLLIKRVGKDRRMLRDVEVNLAEIYHKKGLYEKAVPIYADAIRDVDNFEGSGMLYVKYGRSLLSARMFRAAINNYLNALKDYEQRRKNYSDDIVVEIYMGLGDAYLSEGRYGEGIAIYQKALPYASDVESKKWLLSGIGRGYEGLKNAGAAEKNFTQLKEPANGEFWPKVADYFIASSKPAEKTGSLK